MKTLIVLLSFITLSNTYFMDNSVSWQTDYDKAIKLSKSNKKNVLVYFTGSDWCAPCKQLKKDLFETQEFEKLSEEYVLLYVDIPRNHDLISSNQMTHNKNLLKKLNKKGVFPLLVVVDDKGKIKDEYSGYSMNGEIGYHLDFLKRNQ